MFELAKQEEEDAGEVTPDEDAGEVTPDEDDGEVTPDEDDGEVIPDEDDKEGDDCPFFYFLQTELFGRR